MRRWFVRLIKRHCQLPVMVKSKEFNPGATEISMPLCESLAPLVAPAGPADRADGRYRKFSPKCSLTIDFSRRTNVE